MNTLNITACHKLHRAKIGYMLYRKSSELNIQQLIVFFFNESFIPFFFLFSFHKNWAGTLAETAAIWLSSQSSST